MQEIRLYHPHLNGSLKIEPDGQAFVDALNEMEKLHDAGKPVYVKFLKGDRKGSIARFIPNSSYNARIDTNCDVFIDMCRYRGGFRYEGGAHGVCHWDKRRNKVKVFIPHGFAWLKDYDGPTVWKKFDAKAAKEKLLENPAQHDIDGNELSVGDKVLYVNIRYGGGMKLRHGTISRFEAKADSQLSEIFTIVKLDNSDEESKISDSASLIYKK